MGDGRQQDGDIPEDLRRQSGAGRRDLLPGTEANRGNVAAEVEQPRVEHEHRSVRGNDGSFEIEEDTGRTD